AYHDKGVYTVTLEVSDVMGLTSWAQQQITVLPIETGDDGNDTGSDSPGNDNSVVTTTTTISDTPAPVQLALSTTPVTRAAVGVMYVYDVDVDSREAPVSYSLNQAPIGMKIHTRTGVITWKPKLRQYGDNAVEVHIETDAGDYTTQAFMIKVRLLRRCLAKMVLQDNGQGFDALQRYRRNVLARQPIGSMVMQMYSRHSLEMIRIVQRNPELKKKLSRFFEDIIRSLNLRSDTQQQISLSISTYRLFLDIVHTLRVHGSHALRRDSAFIMKQIEREGLLDKMNIVFEQECGR
ncbi:MAG: hypothetical protein GY868_03015, partial [Deltaproteobacteria bacterium]|nr:hypothetical protein [Deltaproteobacteria bacterium]